MSAVHVTRRRTLSALVLAVAVVVGLLTMHSVTLAADTAQGISTMPGTVDAAAPGLETVPPATPGQQCADQCQVGCPSIDMAGCANGVPAAPVLLWVPDLEAGRAVLAVSNQFPQARVGRAVAARAPSLVALSVSRT